MAALYTAYITYSFLKFHRGIFLFMSFLYIIWLFKFFPPISFRYFWKLVIFTFLQSYSEWLCGFEKKAKECVTGTSGSEEVKVSLRSEVSIF